MDAKTFFSEGHEKIRLGDIQGALFAFTMAENLASDRSDKIDAANARGLCKYSAGDYHGAIETLKETTVKYPDDDSAYLNWVSALKASERVEEISDVLEEGIQNVPLNGNLLLQKSDFLRNQGHDIQSLKLLEDTLNNYRVRNSPFSAQNIHVVLTNRIINQNPERDMAVIKRERGIMYTFAFAAVDMAPENIKALSMFGSLAMEVEEYEKAQSAFYKILIDPKRLKDQDDIVIYSLAGINLTKAFLYDGKIENAAESLDCISEKSPVWKMEPANMVAALVNLTQGKINSAKRYLDRVLKVEKTQISNPVFLFQYKMYRAQALRYLGIIALQEEKFDQAINYLEQLSELDPKPYDKELIKKFTDRENPWRFKQNYLVSLDQEDLKRLLRGEADITNLLLSKPRTYFHDN